MKNKKISEINWPKDTLVVAISRNNKSLIPNGNSVLQKDDDVIISTKEYNKKYLENFLYMF